MAVTIQQAGGTIGGVGTIYRFLLYAWYQDQYGLTGVTYKLNSFTGAGGDFLGNVCESLYNTVQNTWALTQADTVNLLGAKLVQRLVLPASGPLPGIVSDSAMGSVASTVISTPTTGIIKSNTTKIGRAFRGRHYIPFPYATAVDTDSSPTNAYLTKLTNLAALWIAPINAVVGGDTYNFLPVVYHAKTGKHGIPVAGDWDVINSTFTEKKFATQRRRGEFGRFNPNAIT